MFGLCSAALVALAAKACADTRQRFTKAVACGDCPALLGHAAHRRTRYALRAAL
jgi:hypothetical protein